jgi:hypothetical protein
VLEGWTTKGELTAENRRTFDHRDRLTATPIPEKEDALVILVINFPSLVGNGAKANLKTKI